jgi:hypothetical protein
MNKKFLALAFVSAVFFFGCAADGAFFSDNEPPAWDGAPSETNPAAGEGRYCFAGGICIKLNGYFKATDCINQNALIVDSCPDI